MNRLMIVIAEEAGYQVAIYLLGPFGWVKPIEAINHFASDPCGRIVYVHSTDSDREDRHIIFLSDPLILLAWPWITSIRMGMDYCYCSRVP
jgi:hypothetical protein